MAKIDRKFFNRTIKFVIVMGMIIYIDSVINMTSFFNKLIQVMMLIFFNLKIENLNIYTSLFASIAVLWSSDITIVGKSGYSIGLFAIYLIIFTFIGAYGIIYPSYSLYLTLMVFITMSFPILLWIMTDRKVVQST